MIDLETVRMRVQAKKFKVSIPTNMAVYLPDKLIDSLTDNEAHKLLEILPTIGLVQRPDGRWERG